MANHSSFRRNLVLRAVVCLWNVPGLACVSLVEMASSVVGSNQLRGGAVAFRDPNTPSANANVAAAIKTLDLDGSGKIEKSDVEAFAQQRGLSSAQVAAEFRSVDVNGDGELGSDEISAALILMGGNRSTSSAVASSAYSQVDVSKRANPVAEPISATRPSLDSVIGKQPGNDEKQSAASSLVPNNFSLKQVEVLQEVGSHAKASFAQVFEASALSSLQQQRECEKKAAEFQSLARSLRTKAAALTKKALETTVSAATKAADAILKSEGDEARILEEKAQHFENKARNSRAKALQAMDVMNKAQSEMLATLQQA
eukprot:TRINITY_DN534_c0_g1_i1.p1 TRINITY_DN534_c0_g1~~TRINITY_DN534_c0_g1_i1.p1  ORF type:complete len:337 (-),score=60.97 TRINITY_DN534_c0_g1_i1:89-1030(-)